ncbi:MAG: hypothetical protein IPJ04_00285 [Candidatus Eisenbacteria bacterium]|nr:hypothetical protein [Candidatus Eisenbacteria bacterium]
MSRPLHVALDARKLHDGGIGTYIRELLSEYAKAPGADTFTALVEAEDVARIPAPVRTRVVSAGKYGLAEHWRVPDARARPARSCCTRRTSRCRWAGRARAW